VAEAEAEEEEAEAEADESRRALPDLRLRPFSRLDAAECDAYTPLFLVDLTVSAEGQVAFAPSLEQLRASVLALFDGVCGCVVGIRDVRNTLQEAEGDMSSSFGAMAVPGPAEPAVAEARRFVEVLKLKAKVADWFY
jgi:hypothetical protein